MREEPENVAVSCGSGTLTLQVAVDQVVPAEHVVVVGEVKVIPEFPPQSPESHVIADKSQEPAHAPVMSWKSALVTDTVDAVRVLAVPMVLDFTKTRFIDEFQFIVSVQVIVWFHDNVSASVLAAVPVLVKFVKVFAPEIVPEPLVLIFTA